MNCCVGLCPHKPNIYRTEFITWVGEGIQIVIKIIAYTFDWSFSIYFRRCNWFAIWTLLLRSRSLADVSLFLNTRSVIYFDIYSGNRYEEQTENLTRSKVTLRLFQYVLNVDILNSLNKSSKCLSSLASMSTVTSPMPRIPINSLSGAEFLVSRGNFWGIGAMGVECVHKLKNWWAGEDDVVLVQDFFGMLLDYLRL